MGIELDLSIATKLVVKAIAKGYAISVNDGEETVVNRSRDIAQITQALASTDNDLLVIYHVAETRWIGTILLVWGNGEDVIIDMLWPRGKPENEAILNELCED